MRKLIFVMLLCAVLSSCSKDRRFYDGMKDRGPVADSECSFIIKNSDDESMISLTDSCIVYAAPGLIFRYGYDGTLIDTIHVNDIGRVYSFDHDSNGYYEYNIGSLAGFSLTGDTLYTRKVTTLSPIGYLGAGRFAVPDVDSLHTMYSVYCFDANRNEYAPMFDLIELFSPNDSNAINCSYSLACRFGRYTCGKTLLYSHFNSNFIVLNGDADYKVGMDYRGIPASKTIYMGHNRLLEKSDCGIRAGVADTTGVYLITPRYVAERWCDASPEMNIDIYDAENFTYLGSRELPVSKGRKIKTIAKNGDRLVVLYVGGYEGAEIKVFNSENL